MSVRWVGFNIQNQLNSKWGQLILTLWIALISFSLVLNLSISNGYAQSSPTPSASSTASSITLYDFDRICRDTLANAGSSSPTPISQDLTSAAQQKLQYCQSAKSAKVAADANSLVWKIWAAVGTVCFAACAASVQGMYNPYVCMGTTTAGAIADASITRQFMTAMMAIMGVGGAVLINQTINSNNSNKDPKDGDTNKDTSQNRDYGACMLGATATMTAFSKHTLSQSSKSTAISNLINAQPLGSDSAIVSAATGSFSNNRPLTTGTTGFGSPYGSTGMMSPYGMTGTTGMMGGGMMGSTCGGMYGGGMMGGGMMGGGMMNTGMMTRCAVGLDSNLPPMVNTPRFQEDFKKASGMNLSDFVAKSNSPKKDIASALGGTMSNSDTLKTLAALQTLEQKLNQPTPSSIYASGGNARNPSGSEPNLNDIMSNVMGQFGQKNGEETKDVSGVNAIAFANQNRDPSVIVEDKTLNIFDRVTYRYFTVATRVMEGGN